MAVDYCLLFLHHLFLHHLSSALKKTPSYHMIHHQEQEPQQQGYRQKSWAPGNGCFEGFSWKIGL